MLTSLDGGTTCCMYMCTNLLELMPYGVRHRNPTCYHGIKDMFKPQNLYTGKQRTKPNAARGLTNKTPAL